MLNPTPMAKIQTVAAPRRQRRCRLCTARSARFVLIGTLPVCRECYGEKIATVPYAIRIPYARLMVGLEAEGHA